jgi:hypothetical protein
MKHTPWFEGESKPVRVGVFRRRRKLHQHIPSQRGDTVHRYALWDGSAWRTEARTIEDAYKAEDVSAYQSLDWQGLTEAEAAEEARLREEAACSL